MSNRPLPKFKLEIGNIINSYNRKLKTVVCASQYIVNRMFIHDALVGGKECDSVRVLQCADTVYIKTGLSTTKATYLTKYFTKQSSSDKTGYDKYNQKT